jgi:ankyrin repeat protein
MRLLREGGVDLRRKDAATGETALNVAAEAGQLEMVRFLQENGVDPATNAVRVLIRRMRSSTSGEKDTAATDAASAAHTGRNAFLRQTSFVSPPSAIYLNRTVVSTPAGDLSLEDVFNEVKPEGQKKISVTRELPMALTIMGLYRIWPFFSNRLFI